MAQMEQPLKESQLRLHGAECQEAEKALVAQQKNSEVSPVLPSKKTPQDVLDVACQELNTVGNPGFFPNPVATGTELSSQILTTSSPIPSNAPHSLG